ncbi:hypothetical protein BP6252_11270 [Coleophoma cylindrospora]|uniref:Uncharacterized protein n=1 Tax=Coleophoma cylindrospora TaxID=1849047 RepID=A0A3D8QPJ5_9HELO|nr:hypothetical protein BP6252_11270 [Coleophoma cylindrospora]
MIPRPIIYINGFPGVGKYTVGRHLATLLAPLNGKLVHNHLLINPADAVLTRSQPGYQALRRAVRSAIFSALVLEPATHDSVYVFTDFQSQNELGKSVCDEYTAAATARGCIFVPVVMTCGLDENMERLVSYERAEHKKLTNVELARKFRTQEDVYRFEDQPALLEIDVTELEPEVVANRIFEHVLELIGKMD